MSKIGKPLREIKIVPQKIPNTPKESPVPIQVPEKVGV